MNYYIFRHGETLETKHGVAYGNRVRTAEILPEGIPIVKKLANHLKNIKTDFNVSSSYKRCEQTAKIVSQITGKKFEFSDLISEYLKSEETFQQMVGRIKSFLSELKGKGHKNVLICTHGAIFSGLIHLITQGKYLEDQLYDFPRPGILVEIKNKKVKQIDFN